MEKRNVIGRYFSHDELKCRCCDVNQMDQVFVDTLDQIRENYGKPMMVTSGFRCTKHNKKVGGSDFSAHLEGLAVDIAITDSKLRHQLIKAIMSIETASYSDTISFGIHENFIHIDQFYRAFPKVFLY